MGRLDMAKLVYLNLTHQLTVHNIFVFVV